MRPAVAIPTTQGTTMNSNFLLIFGQYLKNGIEFDSESAQYLLWQQQKEHLSCKTNKNMKWHPDYCLPNRLISVAIEWPLKK